LQEGIRDFDGDRPTQAYLGVRLVTADIELEGSGEYLHSLTRMYQNWARERGMRLQSIDATSSRYQVLFLVSGFGSFGILEAESGLHVLEIPNEKGGFDRIRARVQVAPVAVESTDRRRSEGNVATDALDQAAPQKISIVRRWRKEPSPLARDSVRGWRTGRLDQVLAGHFDVLGN